MSLLTEAMRKCTLLSRTETDDSYGGSGTDWAEAGTFYAAIVFNASLAASRADKDTVASDYTVTTKRDVVLKFHDVFRREEDGKVFLVTSDGDDRYTPASAGLDMRQVTASEWSLEDNG